MPKKPIIIKMSAKLLVKLKKGNCSQSLTPVKNNLSSKLEKAPARKKTLPSLPIKAVGG